MLDRDKPPLALFGPLNIALIRSDRGRRLLTHAANAAGEDRNPSFAPFGNRVAHERHFPKGSAPGQSQITNADLCEIGRDGKGLRYVTGLGEEYDTEADWGVRR